MKVGNKVKWDGKEYEITHIEDRNTYDPLPGVKQIGDCVILKDVDGKKIMVYDFDLAYENYPQHAKG